MSGRRLACLTMAGLAALAGCRPSRDALQVRTAPTEVRLCADGGCTGDSVQLTYVGVGGFVLRSGDAAIMTAPSFSNPGFWDVATPWRKIESKPEAVRRGLAGVDLAGVTAIIVGHSHYDHLLDVPTVVRDRLQRAKVYGSPTTANILAGDDSLARWGTAVSLADHAGDAQVPGRWRYLDRNRFRILPIRSSHAPNVSVRQSWRFAYTIAADTVAHPLTELPRRARGWKLGQPYAWIIDVLDPADSTRPTFRVFYQDAASRRQDNVLPLPEPDGKLVDVAIICVGSYGNVKHYPGSVLEAYAPRHVVLGHWEDFFRPAGSALEVIRFTNTAALRDTLDARMRGRWTTPAPKVPLTFLF